MIENKKVITRSLIVLFLSLAIVYSLTYQKKERLFKSSTKISNEIISQTGIHDQNGGSNVQDLISLNYNIEDTGAIGSVSLGDVSDGINGISNIDDKNSNTNKDSNSISLDSTNTKYLPGTTEYFGTLDIISILGEKPEFTLQDSKGNYFAYYGNHLNFVPTIQSLGGNTYEMVTESEILQNQLFGDRVSYINLSMFKDIRVIMVVEIDNDVWLLQIPADKYHYSKDYLKSLFIQ